MTPTIFAKVFKRVTGMIRLNTGKLIDTRQIEN